MLTKDPASRVVSKESLWKMGCCSHMEEGSPMTGDIG